MEPKASHLWPTRVADAAYVVGLHPRTPSSDAQHGGSSDSESDCGTAEWEGASFGKKLWTSFGEQFAFQPGVPSYDATDPLPIVDVIVVCTTASCPHLAELQLPHPLPQVMPSRGDEVPHGYELIEYTVGGLEADLNRGSPFGYATMLAVKRYSPFLEPELTTGSGVHPSEIGEGMVPCVPANDVYPSDQCPLLDIDILSGSAGHVAAAVQRDNTGAGSISGLQYPNGVRRSEHGEDDFGLSAKGFLHHGFGPSLADLQGAGYLPHSLGNPTCLAPWSLVRHTPAGNDADLNVLSGGDTLWLAMRRHASGAALAKPYWGRVAQLIDSGALVAGVAPRPAADADYALEHAAGAEEAAALTSDLAAMASGRVPQALAAAAAAALQSSPSPFISARAHMRGPIVDIVVINTTQGESAPPGYVLLHTSVNLGAMGDRIHLAFRRGKPMGLQDQPLAACLISTYPPPPNDTSAQAAGGMHLRVPPRIDVPAGLPAFVETHGCLFGGALADYRLQSTPSAWTASYQGVLQSQQQLAVGETAAWGHSARILHSGLSTASASTSGSSKTWDGPVLRRRSMNLETISLGGGSSARAGALASHASAESVGVGGGSGAGSDLAGGGITPARQRNNSTKHLLSPPPGPSEMAIPTCLSHAELPPPRHMSELQPCELMDEKGRVSFLYSLRFSRQLPATTAQALTLWYALCRCDGAVLLPAVQRGIAAWGAARDAPTPPRSWLHSAAAMKNLRVPEAAFHMGFLSALQLRGILEESLVAMHNVLLCGGGTEQQQAQPQRQEGAQQALTLHTSAFKQAHLVQVGEKTQRLFGFGLGYAVPLQAYIHLITGDFALPLRPVLPLSVCSTFRLQLTMLPDAQPFIFELPSPLSLPPSSGSYLLLFQCLSPLNIVNVLGLLMLERRVLFHSRNGSALCPVSQALKSLLWPLSWAFQHIPIVPPHMGALLESPVTTLLGMLTDDLPAEIPPEVWLVNLDLDCISRGCAVKSVLPNTEGGGAPKVFFTGDAPEDEVLLSDPSRSRRDVTLLLQSPPASSTDSEWASIIEDLQLTPKFPSASGGVYRWGVPGELVAGSREMCVVPPRLPVQGHIMRGSTGEDCMRLPVSTVASTPARPALLQVLRSPGSPYKQYAQGIEEWNTEHNGGISFGSVARAVQAASTPPPSSTFTPPGLPASAVQSPGKDGAPPFTFSTPAQPAALVPDPAFVSGLPLHSGKASIAADAGLLAAGQFIRDIALAAGAADALTLAGMAGGTAAEGDPFPLCSAAGTVRAIGHAWALQSPGNALGTSTYLGIQHHVHSSIAQLSPGLRAFMLRAVMAAPLVAPLPPLLPPLPNGSMSLSDASLAAVSDMQGSFRGGAASRVNMRSALAEALQDTPQRASAVALQSQSWRDSRMVTPYRPWFHAGAAMHGLQANMPSMPVAMHTAAVVGCPNSHLWCWGELPPSRAAEAGQTRPRSVSTVDGDVPAATVVEHMMVSVPPQAAILLCMRFAALGTGRNPLGVDLTEQVAATTDGDNASTPQILHSSSAAHEEGPIGMRGRRRSATQPDDDDTSVGGGVVTAFFGASAEAEARQRSSRKRRSNPTGAPSRMSMRASANAGAAGTVQRDQSHSSDDEDGAEFELNSAERGSCPSGVPGVSENPYSIAAVTSHGSAIRMGGGPAADANDTILSETRTNRGQAAEKWLGKLTREVAARFLVQALGSWRDHLWLDGEELLKERRSSVLAGVEQQLGAPSSAASERSASPEAFPMGAAGDSDSSSLGSSDDSSDNDEEAASSDDDAADSAVAEAVACAVLSSSSGLAAAPVAARTAAHAAAKAAVMEQLHFVPEHIAGAPVLNLSRSAFAPRPGKAPCPMTAALRRSTLRHVHGGMVQTGDMGLLDELGFVETVAVHGAAMAAGRQRNPDDSPGGQSADQGAALREGVRWGGFASELVHSQLFHLFTQETSEAGGAWARTAAAGVLGAAQGAAAAAAAASWPTVDTRRVAALQAVRSEVEHTAKVFSASRRAYLEQHMLRQAPFQVLCDVVTAPLWGRPTQGGAFDELLSGEGSSHILASPALHTSSPMANRRVSSQSGTSVPASPLAPLPRAFRVPRDSNTPRRLLHVASDRDVRGHAPALPPPPPSSSIHPPPAPLPRQPSEQSDTGSAHGSIGGNLPHAIATEQSPSKRSLLAGRRLLAQSGAGTGGSARNFKSLTPAAYKPRRASARPAFNTATLQSRMRLRALGGAVQSAEEGGSVSATNTGSQRHAALVLQRSLRAPSASSPNVVLKHAGPVEVRAAVDSFLSAGATADGSVGLPWTGVHSPDSSPLGSLEGHPVDAPLASWSSASGELDVHRTASQVWGDLPVSFNRITTEWLAPSGVFMDGPTGTSALSLTEAAQQTLLLCCFGEGDARVLLAQDDTSNDQAGFKVPHMTSVLRLRKQDHSLSSGVVRLAAHVLDVLRRLDAQSKRLARQFLTPSETRLSPSRAPINGATPLPLDTSAAGVQGGALSYLGARASLESLSQFTAASDSVQGAVPFVNLRISDASDMFIAPLQWEADQELGPPGAAGGDTLTGISSWAGLAVSCRSTSARLRFTYGTEWDMDLQGGVPGGVMLPWRLSQGAASRTAQHRLLRLLSKKGHEQAAEEFHTLTRPPGTSAECIWPQYMQGVGAGHSSPGGAGSPARPGSKGTPSAEPSRQGTPALSSRVLVATQLLRFAKAAWRWLLASKAVPSSDATATRVLLAVGTALAFKCDPAELLSLLSWLGELPEVSHNLPLVQLASGTVLVALAAQEQHVSPAAVAACLAAFPPLAPDVCSCCAERLLAQLVLPPHMRKTRSSWLGPNGAASSQHSGINIATGTECNAYVVACLAVLLQSSRVQELQQQVADTEAANLHTATDGSIVSASAASAPGGARKASKRQHRRKPSDAERTVVVGPGTPLRGGADGGVAASPPDAHTASEAALLTARRANLARSHSATRKVVFDFAAETEEGVGGSSEQGSGSSQHRHRRHHTASGTAQLLLALESPGSADLSMSSFSRDRVHSRSARKASSQAKMLAAASVNEWLFSAAQGTGVVTSRRTHTSAAGELLGPSTPILRGESGPVDRSRRYSEAATNSSVLARSASDGRLGVQRGNNPSNDPPLPPLSPNPAPTRKNTLRSLTISTSSRSMQPMSPIKSPRAEPEPFSTPQSYEGGVGGVGSGRMAVSENNTPTPNTAGPRQRGGRRSTIDSRPLHGPMRGVFTMAARVTSYLQQQGVCVSTGGAMEHSAHTHSGMACSQHIRDVLQALGGQDGTKKAPVTLESPSSANTAVFVLSVGPLEALEGGSAGNGALFAGASAEAESQLSQMQGAGHMRSRTSMAVPVEGGGSADEGGGSASSGSQVLSLYRMLPPSADKAAGTALPSAAGVTRQALRSADRARSLLGHLLSLEGPLDSNPGGAPGDSFSFVATMQEDVTPGVALALLWLLASEEAPLAKAAVTRLLLQVSTFMTRTAGLQLPTVTRTTDVLLMLPRSNDAFSVTAAWRAVQTHHASDSLQGAILMDD